MLKFGGCSRAGYHPLIITNKRSFVIANKNVSLGFVTAALSRSKDHSLKVQLSLDTISFCCPDFPLSAFASSVLR